MIPRTLRPALVLALVATALVVAGAASPAMGGTPAPAQAAKVHTCGNLTTVIVARIRATRTSCTVARRVALRFAKRAGCYRHGCHQSGYTCKRIVQGYESYRARCSRKYKRITFLYGA